MSTARWRHPNLMRYTAWAIGFLSCSGVASGDGPPLEMDTVVRRALAHNRGLSAASREVLASRSGERSAASLANPEVLFLPGITSISGTGEELLIQQPLELNGSRKARVEIARAQTSAAFASAVVELRALVHSAKSAYLELHRARQRRVLSVRSLEYLTEVHRLTERQVELGVRPGIDRTRTRLEMERAQQTLDRDEGEELVAAASLNRWMGTPAASPIEELALPSAQTGPLDRAALVRLALDARAEIQRERALLTASHQEGRLARAEGRPDLMPQLRSGSMVRGVRDTGIGLGLTLPVFDLGRRRHRVRQAEEEARAQQDRVEDWKGQIEAEVSRAVARLVAARKVASKFESGLLANARRVLEAQQVGYRLGQIPVQAVMEAQQSYRSVASEHLNATIDVSLAEVDLEQAVGAVPSAWLPTVAERKR